MPDMQQIARFERPPGLGSLFHRSILSEGIGVGFVGGLTVAVWFLILDTLTRYPFHTPAALGSVLFLGAQSAAEIRNTAAMVAAYTVLHFTAFAAVGVVFVWVARRVLQVPGRWLLVGMTFVVLDALFIGTLAMMAEWLVRSIGVWAVLVANLIAVMVMGAAIWLRHPELRHRFERPIHTAV